MGVCLIEVPTVQSGGVVNVFWVQKGLNFGEFLVFWKRTQLKRNFGHFFILEGRQLELGSSMENST